MRKLRVALLAASFISLALAIAWFVLNHFRVQFYNSAMEGQSPESSPYWTIIRVQSVLEWPIFFFALCAALLILCELAHFIGARFQR